MVRIVPLEKKRILSNKIDGNHTVIFTGFAFLFFTFGTTRMEQCSFEKLFRTISF